MMSYSINTIYKILCYECVETMESEIGTIQIFALGLVGLLSLKSEHDKKFLSVL